ncbi:MAG: ShlB/FhaC/HecB family hemolysin secretion/activation protein [Coleofasciculus sp. C1-SOL-03]|uniref:ShlB/FhaC/HecB family hemolysin secretion/activation protein n=1 Tax=Coleofasciculus sp. C1-SOL-03 TaxID=3069522 RepID=UPI0032FC8009
MNKMIGVNSNGQILFTSIAALWAAFWLTPSVNAQTISTNTKSSADQGLSLTKAEDSIKAEDRGQRAAGKQSGGKVEGHDNCLGGHEITPSTLSQGGFCPNVTIHSQTTVPKPAPTNQVSDTPRVNVTDLRLVGNAHPTIDKGFWRSPNAYFSAIPPRVGSILNPQHSTFNAQVPDRTPRRESPSIPELPPPQDIEPPPPSRRPETTPSPTLPPPEQLLDPEFTPTTPEIPETPEGATQEQITVQKFEFTGNTAFSDQELAEVTAEFTNRPITFAELLNARTAVTQLYVNNGYATSGAFIPPQPLTQDTVTIEIVEGGIEQIQVNGLRRLRANYVRSRIAVANPKPLNVPHLLESLRLLQLDPLIENISAELSTGSGPGTSLLIVDIIEANTWSYQLFANNGRSPSVGSFRRGASITQANLLGFGDGVTLSYTNTDGSDEIEFNYTLPVNPRNGTISFSFSNTSSEIIEDPFNFLDIQSDSTSFDLTFRQPLIETPTQELAVGLTASRRNTKTVFLEDLVGEEVGFPSLGADEDGEIRVSALRFFQEWTQRGASEVFALRSQFNWGLGLFNATVNDDAPDSLFFSWRGQAQWVRLLAPDTLLVLQGDVQLAAQDLLPVEQIGLGGLGSVRGYRQDIRLTDNGAFASAEVRLPILRIPEWDGVLQVTPFVDVGTVWNNGEIDDPDPSSLASLGLGLQWQQGDRITARLDWGIPLISVDSEDDTLQENGVYFSITINPF